jgi:hypothetical protein
LSLVGIVHPLGVKYIGQRSVTMENNNSPPHKKSRK